VAYRRGDYRDKWRIENTAASVRRELGLDQFVVLDPGLLVDHLEAEVFYLRDLIHDEVALRRARRAGFDGCASRHPETGRPVIILNCGKPRRRRTATLMEELAHLLLEHRPCRLIPDPHLGIVWRSFNRQQENEAYDMGAALLLPKERIQRDVKELELLVPEIASEHGCSEQLVAYRIQRMRLWNRYTAYASAAS
jgi:hypothetical protein